MRKIITNYKLLTAENGESTKATGGTKLTPETRTLPRVYRICHQELTEALGLHHLETDGVLTRHRVSTRVTANEMRVQAAASRVARSKSSLCCVSLGSDSESGSSPTSSELGSLTNPHARGGRAATDAEEGGHADFQMEERDLMKGNDG